MAKGKNRQNSGTRDLVTIATSPLVRSPSQSLFGNLYEVSDMRAFDFDQDTRPAKLFNGLDASVGATHTPTKNKGLSKVPYQIAFSAPAETLVCVRRSRRKQVLFAKRKTGKGGQRRPRRNKWSDVKC